MICQNLNKNKSFFFSSFQTVSKPFESFTFSTFATSYFSPWFSKIQKLEQKSLKEKPFFWVAKQPTFFSVLVNRKPYFKETSLKQKTLHTALTDENSKNSHLFGLISLCSTKNNTHATISNLFGEKKTKWSISAGQLKLQGGRRKTRLSQRMIYKSCLEKALSFGYKYTVIHCKGTRGSKVRIFRFFGNSLSVLLIKDTTGAAHNGCRPPKIRRV
uniref:Ribosomal protein S11 n=1 Tax=Rhexinema sarcinoideum TaxID=43261 RepID=A0A1B2RYV6_9CHLO|nr:ribosomal protein S11 [Rhexinema sarcinoideum]